MLITKIENPALFNADMFAALFIQSIARSETNWTLIAIFQDMLEELKRGGIVS